MVMIIFRYGNLACQPFKAGRFLTVNPLSNISNKVLVRSIFTTYTWHDFKVQGASGQTRFPSFIRWPLALIESNTLAIENSRKLTAQK